MRTPLVRLELGSEFPDIRLKLENLQPINAYKLRGAANAVALLSGRQRKRGVWTISAGNAGQGVAYAARAGRRALHGRRDRDGAEIKTGTDESARRKTHPCAHTMSHGKRWRNVHFPEPKEPLFIRSTMTISLLVMPRWVWKFSKMRPRPAAVIASIGGGGLITGVASAIKALKPEVKIFGVEPETAAPAALSFEKGSPQVFKDWRASFVDGAGGQSMFPRMWERMKPVVDDYIVVSLDETKRAMRLMAEKARVISEGAGALPLAAALTGKAGKGPIVAIVSGGNIDLNKFCELIAS